MKTKLLYIDDDECSRILIKEFLAYLNVEIIEAANGEEGISLYEKHKNDLALILTDIKLPGCNGWEVCNQIRKDNEKISLIAISALPPTELEQECKCTGFTDYVSKPFKAVMFIEKVEKYLKINSLIH